MKYKSISELLSIIQDEYILLYIGSDCTYDTLVDVFTKLEGFGYTWLSGCKLTERVPDDWDMGIITPTCRISINSSKKIITGVLYVDSNHIYTVNNDGSLQPKANK